jgi:hypothetical protein
LSASVTSGDSSHSQVSPPFPVNSFLVMDLKFCRQQKCSYVRECILQEL